MLKQLRQTVINHLWETYCLSSVETQKIELALKQKGIERLILDHFAIIDLPSPHSGIDTLTKIFSSLGYQLKGKDYLAEKQNDFVWLSEPNENGMAKDLLPQVVVADFRLNELPKEIEKIISRYAMQAKPFPWNEFQKLLERLIKNDKSSKLQLCNIILQYFTGRDWPLPTVDEFKLVHEFNELLAWVLIFGRKPNHFTLSIHLLNHFADLPAFNDFITQELQLELNMEGGLIKGGLHSGIAQSSTLGSLQQVELADGIANIPTGFVEFVWRYPRDKHIKNPILWNDYFTGFVANHANHVIESLYEKKH